MAKRFRCPPPRMASGETRPPLSCVVGRRDDLFGSTSWRSLVRAQQRPSRSCCARTSAMACPPGSLCFEPNHDERSLNHAIGGKSSTSTADPAICEVRGRAGRDETQRSRGPVGTGAATRPSKPPGSATSAFFGHLTTGRATFRNFQQPCGLKAAGGRFLNGTESPPCLSRFRRFAGAGDLTARTRTASLAPR